MPWKCCAIYTVIIIIYSPKLCLDSCGWLMPSVGWWGDNITSWSPKLGSYHNYMTRTVPYSLEAALRVRPGFDHSCFWDTPFLCWYYSSTLTEHTALPFLTSKCSCSQARVEHHTLKYIIHANSHVHNLLSLLLRENNCLAFLRVMPINFCRVLITFNVRDMRSDRWIAGDCSLFNNPAQSKNSTAHHSILIMYAEIG